MVEQTPDMSAPIQAASALTASLTEAVHKNRLLIEQMAQFTRNESLRFFQRRMEQDTAAMSKLQDAHGIGAIIGVQQEWLRGLFQDYAGQNMRIAGLVHDLTQDAFDRCGEVAGMGLDSVRQAANGMAGQMHRAGEQAAHAAADMPAEMVDNPQPYAETQH